VSNIKAFEEKDRVYNIHKVGYNEAVKQYNYSDIKCTLYLGTAHKNENTGTLWKLPEM
jgi:hypothetical protein